MLRTECAMDLFVMMKRFRLVKHMKCFEFCFVSFERTISEVASILFDTKLLITFSEINFQLYTSPRSCLFIFISCNTSNMSIWQIYQSYATVLLPIILYWICLACDCFCDNNVDRVWVIYFQNLPMSQTPWNEKSFPFWVGSQMYLTEAKHEYEIFFDNGKKKTKTIYININCLNKK